MSISEDRIMAHLDWHLTQGDPGQALHHLAVLRAPAGAVGPLGGVDEEKLHMAMYAIAPVGDVAQDLLAGAAMRAMAEARRENASIVFVALSQEMVSLPHDAPGQELAREIVAAGRLLTEHPHAEEATVIYAACSDGRRWRGRRFLTRAEGGHHRGRRATGGRTPARGEPRDRAGAADPAHGPPFLTQGPPPLEKAGPLP